VVAIQIRDPDTDPDPYRDTGKTCLDGGMHCSVLLVLELIAYMFMYFVFEPYSVSLFHLLSTSLFLPLS